MTEEVKRSAADLGARARHRARSVPRSTGWWPSCAASGYQASTRRVDEPAALRAALADDGPWDLLLGDPALARTCRSRPSRRPCRPAAANCRSSRCGSAGRRRRRRRRRWWSPPCAPAPAISSTVRRLDRLGPAVDRALRDAVARDEKRRTREQLLVIERMASVGTLAAGVAHEINNPLAAVMANIELALRTLDSLPPGGARGGRADGGAARRPRGGVPGPADRPRREAVLPARRRAGRPGGRAPGAGWRRPHGLERDPPPGPAGEGLRRRARRCGPPRRAWARCSSTC